MVARFEQDPLIGSLLADKYQIIRRVGTGGMGAVYEGLHVLMERTVAIKVVHAHWVEMDPGCLRRFHLEAKASSCLNHPNIMTVYDFGITSDGVAYLVMDYIIGEGLDVILRRERRLPLDRIAPIFTQACNALAHAHDKQIVHRDLKPSNIMVSRNAEGAEHVKIVDFGIAKFMPGRERASSQRARDSQVVGSPLYMSPEQCRADKKLDGRSDIYSLGCLLYQALSGRPPIQEEDVLGVIYGHLNEMPRPLSEVCPELSAPPSLEALVLKALAKDPDHRQQSMRELRDELQAVQKQLQTEKTDRLMPPALIPPPGTDRLEAGGGPALVPRIHDLADFYKSQHQSSKAEQQLRAAVQYLVDSNGVWDVQVAESVKKLADFYRDEGRYREAEPLYLDLLAIKRKALGSQHPDIPCILLRLADTYFALSQYDSSRRYYSQCLRLAEDLYGKDDPALTSILTGYASVLRRLQRSKEAEEQYLRVLCLKELHLGIEHYELAATLIGLGVVYRYDKRYKDSERVFNRALHIYRENAGGESLETASLLLLLGELYSIQSMDADAEELFSQAVNIRENCKADRLEIAAAYEIWAAHYLRRKALPKAEMLYGKIIAIKEEALGSYHPQMAETLSVLAALNQAQKKYETAEALYKRAVACAGGGTVTVALKPLEL